MENITVVFENGNIVTFIGENFAPNMSASAGYLNKYEYKDAQGNDSFIYLKPNKISGIFKTVGVDGLDGAISYSVSKQ